MTFTFIPQRFVCINHQTDLEKCMFSQHFNTFMSVNTSSSCGHRSIVVVVVVVAVVVQYTTYLDSNLLIPRTAVRLISGFYLRSYN